MSEKTTTTTAAGVTFRVVPPQEIAATALPAQPAARRTGGRTLWLVGLLVLLAAAWPTAAFSDYHLFQLTMVVVYAIAILGLSLLTGFNGQISLGHGAFYAIGAYTTAILMTTWDVPVLGDAAGLRRWSAPCSAS